MHHLKTLIYSSLLFASLSLQQTTEQPRTIYQFPNPTWLENIAATRNGSLLTGAIGVAELHLIDPFATSNTTASSLLYSFPSADSVFGISELSLDVWAVATGNYSITEGTTNYSSSVWKVDLSGDAAKVDKIADIETAQLVNGVAALNQHTVLLADSQAGNVLALDVKSGKYGVVLEDETMAANASNPIITIGVNGLKVLDSTLYFTNSQLQTVNKVPVDPRTGQATGAFTVLAADQGVVDDFTITEDGTLFVAKVWLNEVARITPDGEEVKVADLLGPTSVTLGRTWRDRGVIYQSTMGGRDEVNVGSYLEGGKVAAIPLN